MKILLDKKCVDDSKCFIKPVKMNDGAARNGFGMLKVPGAEIYYRSTALAGQYRKPMGTADDWTVLIEQTSTFSKKGAHFLVGT